VSKEVSTIKNDNLIEILTGTSAGNAMNGMIHALGVWFHMHIRGADADQRMKDAYSTFSTRAYNTAKKGMPDRKSWPRSKPLPEFDNNSQVLESISQQLLQQIQELSFEEGLIFIGELWGRWLLVCPIEILKDAFGDSQDTTGEWSEAEVLDNTLRYLDLYGSMPMGKSLSAS
jgi:hypothetical protein